MTLTPALETEHPGGRQREVVMAMCDAPKCWAWDTVGRHGGDTTKVQKLLHRRGWSTTGDRDLCPTHAAQGDRETHQ